MDPFCILKNPWTENRQYFGTDWVSVEVGGKPFRFYWCIFPS